MPKDVVHLRMVFKSILNDSGIDAAYDPTYPNVHTPLEPRSGFTISTTEQAIGINPRPRRSKQ